MAIAVMVATLAAWGLGEEHVAGRDEVLAFRSALGEACFLSMFTWTAYVAIEPAVGRASQLATPHDVVDPLGRRTRRRSARGTRPSHTGLITYWGISALLSIALVVVLWRVCRRQWLVVIAFLVVNFARIGQLSVGGLFMLAMYALMLLAFLRFGFLATVVGMVVTGWLAASPLTLDPSDWYFQISMLAVTLCAALAGYGFWRSSALGMAEPAS